MFTIAEYTLWCREVLGILYETSKHVVVQRLYGNDTAVIAVVDVVYPEITDHTLKLYYNFTDKDTYIVYSNMGDKRLVKHIRGTTLTETETLAEIFGLKQVWPVLDEEETTDAH